MNGSKHTAIAAAGASLLAAFPLAGVFRTFSWLIYALGAVLVVYAAGLLTRSLRTAFWVRLAAMLAALTVLLTWLFGGGTAILGLVPGTGTFPRFGRLIGNSVADAQALASPVPDTTGLMFVVTMSIGLLAIMVDVIAIRLRQPALAGLPMLAVYSVPVAVLSHSASWFSFALAAAGYLWLLVADQIGEVRRWGRRFADDGRDVDVWESSPLAATGRRLGLIGLLAAVLIPLAVPGMTAGFLERVIIGSGTGIGAGGQSGRSVDPIAALKGNLNRREVTAMLRVRTKDQNPGYLRLAVADRLTDERAEPSRERSIGTVGQARPASLPRGLPDDPILDADRGTARITVLALAQGYLPTYQYPTNIRPFFDDPRRWYVDDSTSVIWSRDRTRRGYEYRLDYVTYNFTPEQLRGASPIPASDPLAQRFTAVPPNPTVQRLVNRLTRDQPTQYDKVRGIYDYFSAENGFTYSTRVDEGTSGSAVVDFLRNKRGFCQQYSVSMTWLLRAAGIPARVVIGFTQGKPERGGFLIRNTDAHAWVEVYFDGYGWVPFDPTPAGPVSNDVRLPWAPNPYRPEPDPSASGSASADPSGGPNAAPSNPRNREDLAGVGAPGGRSDPPTRWPYWLFAGIVMAVLLASPAVRRWLLRRRRLAVASGKDPTEAAATAWQELIDTLVDLDIEHHASDTPRTVVRRLIDARPRLLEHTAAQAELLARAAERAAYSRSPIANDQLARAVRAVSAELRKNAVYGLAKLRTRVFPESVIRAWRAGFEATQQYVLTGWERGRDAFNRWLRGNLTRRA